MHEKLQTHWHFFKEDKKTAIWTIDFPSGGIILQQEAQQGTTEQ